MMEQVKTLNVAIVGGGPGCKAIVDMIFAEKLQQLRMKLIGVACTDRKAVGYRYAQEKGIYTTGDYRDLYKLKDLNMIIELTGHDEVSDQISRTRPEHIQVMNHVAARLFWDVFQIEEERISERRRAEAAIEQAYAELNQIFNTSADAMRVVDRDFNVIRVNDTFSIVSGISKYKAEGRKCYDSFPGPMCHTPECPLRRILGGEERVECDSEKRRIDGTIIPCIVTATPFRGHSGELIGIVENFKDITERKHAEEALLESIHRVQVAYDQSIIYAEQLKEEIAERKRAEEALRESEIRYRTLFNSASDIIFIHDLSGHIVDFNEVTCERLGYSRAELLEMTVMDIDAPEYADLVSERINELGQLGHVIFETAHITREGRTIPTEVSARLIEYAGRPVVLSIARDITERKLAEEEKKKLQTQLLHAQKMQAIGTLAGGIAHDFNNLLMGILGRTSLMMLHTDSDHPYFRHLKGIEDIVQRGAHLTRQLLGFARGGKYEVKPTNLNELIEVNSDMFGRTKKEIKIHRKYEKDIWSVEVDRGQVDQVLLNLYVNAWQAMPRGGDLYIETSNVVLEKSYTGPLNAKPGRYVKVSVSDTGVGMDEATQQRIFDPFFTTKEMGRGTGLGLASAYGIIRNHGGIINVYSEKGKGAIFNIYLPASEKEVTIQEKKPVAQIVRGNETVLFVDDEDMILNVGRDVLEDMGYKVLVARSGKEAVEVYSKHKDRIDLVIVDMIMPEMGGGEVYDRIKEHNPKVKALLSSGYSINGEAAEILKRGCHGFIQKPFNMKELSEKIRQILKKK